MNKMDGIIYVLYILFMKYFDGVRWLAFNHVEDCRARVAKRFQGYYTLDYAHSGSVRLRIDGGGTQVLNGPVAWWTYPGPFFEFEPASPGGGWDHRHICFQGTRTAAWRRQGLMNPEAGPAAVPIHQAERFRTAMDGVLAHLRNPVHGPARTVQLFEGLLLQLHEQGAPPPGTSPVEQRIFSCAEAMAQRPGDPWDMAAEARRAGASLSHFRLLFQRLTGEPPARYLTRQRMQLAAALLQQPEPGLQQIADLCGYPDIYHFHKRFRSHFHLPPGQFRKRSLLQ